MKKYIFSISDDSDMYLKIKYNDVEYPISKNKAEIYIDSDYAELELIQISKRTKWNVLNILFLIAGLIIIPICNVLFMTFPRFNEEVSPLLFRGRYLVKSTSNEKIVLNTVESAWKNNELILPQINISQGDLIPVETQYEINFLDIKYSMFYCIYNISCWVFLGLFLVFLSLWSIDDMAAKLAIVIFLSLAVVSVWIIVFINVKKQKSALYEHFGSINKIISK